MILVIGLVERVGEKALPVDRKLSHTFVMRQAVTEHVHQLARAGAYGAKTMFLCHHLGLVGSYS
jgi:hypothetical protein